MIDEYLTIEVEIEHEPPKDDRGEPTGIGRRRRAMATYSSRSRTVTTQAGEEVVASGVFTLGSAVPIGYHDRIIHEGVRYRPVQIVRPRSLDGPISTRVYVQ